MVVCLQRSHTRGSISDSDEFANSIRTIDELDFIQLRGIANHVHEAVKHDTGNLYPVGLRL
jgi:hypothetical protein